MAVLEMGNYASFYNLDYGLLFLSQRYLIRIQL